MAPSILLDVTAAGDPQALEGAKGSRKRRLRLRSGEGNRVSHDVFRKRCDSGRSTHSGPSGAYSSPKGAHLSPDGTHSTSRGAYSSPRDASQSSKRCPFSSIRSTNSSPGRCRVGLGVPIRVLRNGCIGSARSGSTGMLFVSGPLLKLDPLRLRLFEARAMLETCT
jgi:hypothetical protein